MPLTQRNQPYIWTTWLTKLLSGDNSCVWATWFKAHYQGWTKPPTTFDPTNWMLAHTALMNKCIAQIDTHSSQYLVTIEGQNQFKLTGVSATLAGKPDIVVTNPQKNLVTVIDVKSGKPSPSHGVQVLLYMYALPLALPRYKDMTMQGLLYYGDEHANIAISPDKLTDQFKEQVAATIATVASPTPPIKVPSSQECSFCDISIEDCPERIDQDIVTGSTMDF